MNYGIIRYVLGWTMKIEGAFMVLPLICAFLYKENAGVSTFALCIAICFALGHLLSIKKPQNKEMFAKEGFVIVALSWIVISLLGALPFVISGSISNYIDALFETASGFSTTGASILSDVESLSKGILLWRSLTHWIGGMGVLVFMVAILPISGGNNIYLIKAESPGPSVGKLVPKVKTTAKILYAIYISLTLSQIILLLCGGMNMFEALTHAFGTAGTGGFGIKNNSLAGYSSYCQNVITIFMLIFGVDFSLYHLILMKKFKLTIRSDELKGYLIIIVSAILLIFLNTFGMFESVLDAFKHIAFQVASIITTTGYSTTDFDKWPEFSKVILLILMFVGACAGSTGGGIKVSRIIILLKSIIKEVKLCAHPRATVKTTMNGRPVEHETIRGINVFMVAYISVFFVALLIISLDKFDFSTNFSAVVATFNNIGPGFSKVGPVCNYSEYSSLSKLVLTMCMLTGRLEIFPMLTLFAFSTWRK